MDKILTKFRQTILLLDPNILLTKLGQNVDIFLSKFCQIYKNLGQSNSLQTNLGQLTKILDKILTKIRQNLVKLRLFWQLLDIDKTWTKVWQKMDKTLTFVQKLSKFCHTPHSSGAPDCVNAAGKLRQKWKAATGIKFTKPGAPTLADLRNCSAIS